MATSLLFSINDFVLLEYIYSQAPDIIQHSTSDIGFRKVINGHENDENIIVNKQSGTQITRNVVDDTVVELDDGRYALLDNDSAFFYPNADPEVSVQDINVSPALNVTYDKVRVHILSGYNFEDLEGFIISIYARQANDKKVRLCNLSHLKSDTSRLFFNPTPLKLSDFIYDKYVEFEIPSHDYMLDQQQLNPGSSNILSWYITNGEYLAEQNTIYCEYRDIRRQIPEEGLIFFDPGEEIRFAFNSTDEFDLLVAKIQQADDGDYFEYFAQWDGALIEDFIFRLNSVAGNRFIIIHEIRVIEQVGQSFTETDNITSIQTGDFDSIKRFRPILSLADSATSFTLEYTVRLYNTVDGRSIFKTSSLSSTDVNKYGKRTQRLDVGNTTNPLKVYNKLQQRAEFSIQDNLLELTKTKLLSTFVNSNNVVVSSNSDVDNTTSGVTIKITPFDNVLKFNIRKPEDPENPDDLSSVDLGGVSKYFMVFIKDDGSKMYINQFLSKQFDRSEGELAFKISKQRSAEIAKIKSNNTFYVISRNPDGLETTLFEASFRIGGSDQDVPSFANPT